MVRRLRRIQELQALHSVSAIFLAAGRVRLGNSALVVDSDS